MQGAIIIKQQHHHQHHCDCLLNLLFAHTHAVMLWYIGCTLQVGVEAGLQAAEARSPPQQQLIL